MISRNLRHLRLCLAVADSGSASAAAEARGLSQPAVTQALRGLEAAAGGALFRRTGQGLAPTPRGDVLVARLRRAFATLDPALDDLGRGLRRTATMPQLAALIAACDTGNATLAARRLGLAQPTVHRALTDLARAAGRPLFERSGPVLTPVRAARALAQAAELARAELAQAQADLGDLDGAEVGRIVVGALPLSRSVILPRALTAFRAARPRQRVTVVDGPYDELLAGLRRGAVDLMLGALRDPVPIRDVVQERLFDDDLAVIARPGHPAVAAPPRALRDHADARWIVPAEGTPTRDRFDAAFAGGPAPGRILETGSVLLMRGLLRESDDLGCLSAAQAAAEIETGLLARVPVTDRWAGRPIGLTTRLGWLPTRGQALLLDLIRAATVPLDAPRR